jgi:sodium/potassium-transporting ATPase subunit alpha
MSSSPVQLTVKEKSAAIFKDTSTSVNPTPALKEKPTLANETAVVRPKTALERVKSAIGQDKPILVKEKFDSKHYHKRRPSDIAHDFETSTIDGLTKEKARQRLAQNGKNKIKPKRKNPVLKIISYFFTGFCGLLWIAAIVCVLCYQPLGAPNPQFINLAIAGLLVAVILLQAVFSAFQDWSSYKMMKSIKNLLPSRAIVVRDGNEETIKSEEIVVGDLIVLLSGNKVPADCRIIESNDLKFDNSMLTGESDPVEGTTDCTDERYVESKNLAFMSALIVNGRGKAIVVDVGKQTVIGQVSHLTNTTKSKTTNLQREIRRFVIIIVCLALVMVVIVTITWAAWLNVYYPGYLTTVNFLVNTMSVAIAFIPEGLPVCVTLSLLVIAKRMAKNNVLVKDLSIIETLSCVNVIASDKTGTLTQNKMFVSSASVGVTKISLKAEEDLERAIVGFNQLVCSAGLCNNAKYADEDDKTKLGTDQRPATGDATDIALLRFSTEYNKVKDFNAKYEIKAEIPFNSRNKWMVKIVRPTDFQTHERIFASKTDSQKDLILLKGAPDILLRKSTQVLQPDGNTIELNEFVKNQIIAIQNEWAKKGQRVLVICKKKCNYDDLSAKLHNQKLDEIIQVSNDFCIVGLVGIIDPPREG